MVSGGLSMILSELGHIAKAMDAQRLYNLQVSMLADSATQDTGSIPIVGKSQIKNWRNIGKLEIRTDPLFYH